MTIMIPYIRSSPNSNNNSKGMNNKVARSENQRASFSLKRGTLFIIISRVFGTTRKRG